MWWKSNGGFFLTELLLSLSAWLIATTILLPLAIYLIGQSIDLRHGTDALHLLYERLQEMKLGISIPTEIDSVEKNGKVFHYKVNHHESESVMEVCVEYNGYFSEKRTKCAFTE
jgi:competence protein ComGE